MCTVSITGSPFEELLGLEWQLGKGRDVTPARAASG